MAAPRRPAPPAPQPVAAPAANLVNFMSPDFYAGGFQLPAGYYALSFEFVLHQPTNRQTGQTTGPMGLKVAVTAYPISNAGYGEPMEPQYLSMGRKAIDSFAPNPDNPKQLVQIPDAAGATANNKTNWYLFLKSMWDCGMPQDWASNDLSKLDGMWVHTDLVDEPEERKGFGANTGESAQQEGRLGTGKTIIVTEFLDGGKPWEGGGGLPDVQAAPPAPTPRAVAPRAPGGPAAPRVTAPVAPKPNGGAGRPMIPPARPVAPAPVVPTEAEMATAETDGDVPTAAINAASEALASSPGGMTKVLLKTQTFKAASKAYGEQIANAVLATYFNSDDNIGLLIGELGYVVSGANVKPLPK